MALHVFLEENGDETQSKITLDNLPGMRAPPCLSFVQSWLQGNQEVDALHSPTQSRNLWRESPRTEKVNSG